MIVVVNGKQVDLDPGATLTSVLEQLTVGPAGVAVALNGEVVPRSSWAETRLGTNDCVEVLTAAQGG